MLAQAVEPADVDQLAVSRTHPVEHLGLGLEECGQQPGIAGLVTSLPTCVLEPEGRSAHDLRTDGFATTAQGLDEVAARATQQSQDRVTRPQAVEGRGDADDAEVLGLAALVLLDHQLIRSLVDFGLVLELTYLQVSQRDARREAIVAAEDRELPSTVLLNLTFLDVAPLRDLAGDQVQVLEGLDLSELDGQTAEHEVDLIVLGRKFDEPG